MIIFSNKSIMEDILTNVFIYLTMYALPSSMLFYGIYYGFIWENIYWMGTSFLATYVFLNNYWFLAYKSTYALALILFVVLEIAVFIFSKLI